MATLAAPPDRASEAVALPSTNGRVAQIRRFLGLKGHGDTQSHQLSDATNVLDLLTEQGAIQDGHFEYESGRHGRHYVEKFRLLERPKIGAGLCQQIADEFKDLAPEVVAGPTTGGLLLAYETARALGNEVLAYFAEPNSAHDGRVFGRGFEFQLGQPTLIVDDVLTTGRSLRDTIEAVRAKGGKPIGVGVIVDRTNGAKAPDGELDGLPFFACLSIDIPSYPPGPDECPLCAEDVPLTVT